MKHYTKLANPIMDARDHIEETLFNEDGRLNKLHVGFGVIASVVDLGTAYAVANIMANNVILPKNPIAKIVINTSIAVCANAVAWKAFVATYDSCLEFEREYLA